MPSTFSPNRNFELQGTGENSGLWGIKANAVLSQVDQNLGGQYAPNVAGSSDVTLTSSQSYNFYHNLTGALTGNINYIFPAATGGFFLINNATSGAFSVTVKAAGGTGVVVPQGSNTFIALDPTNLIALSLQPLVVSGGGLQFSSQALERSALTGDVTASAGSNATSFALLTTRGDVVIHNATVAARLALGAQYSMLASDGTDSLWKTLSYILDGAIGNTRGMALVRGASTWGALAVGAADTAVVSNGTDPAWGKLPESFVLAVSDETTALTTGTAKVKFRMPYAFTLSAVRASLSTAQSSGSIFTVNIKESGTTVLSTLLTIDNTETTSQTAATPPVISDTSLADDAEITVDISQVGDGTAKGLKVVLIGKRT